MYDPNEIQKHGANARARMEPKGSCPYRKPPVFEKDKQLSNEQWERLAESWEIGWDMEDMMRRTI